MSRLIAALKTNFWIENRRDISIQPARITEREQISAVTPEGSHPIPSRTRKLRPPGPMVLQGGPCGRVGRRRELFAKPLELAGSRGFFLPSALRGGAGVELGEVPPEALGDEVLDAVARDGEALALAA